MGSRRVVETLTRTGGFGKHVTRRRLLETFQHILDVTRDLESVRPGGKGFASSIRVRFLHAAVRRRILQLAAENPAYYSVEEFGIPVNDLDSIGTVLTFSATLIWLGFPRQGIFLRSQEISDYLALWRWVGYILGAPTEPYLSSPAHAKAMMDSLIVSGEIAPTATSRTLANNIIAGLQGRPPMNASADFLRAEAYWLNGTELATALAIPKPPLYYTILVAGQCLFLMTLCYLKRSIPPWDEANIRRLRRLIHKITLDQFEDKKEAAFEFRYIPNFGKITEGDSGSTTTTDEKERPSVMAAFWARNKSVEGRNLHTVLVASAVMGWIAWLGLKSAASLLQ
ncbi:hypothetical protein QBC46DRAFT_369743 [Diplogelasinospora grovesii]|uniref:ER-bound oxygenase mpaB/mpaB'/Rubber oxygenase catalytic domain-containing protein n=1 Tax=Diplogelasinospora grovesii TaxID=303347 RepID=A0AAN6NIH6_9PEZI|nr:hypothetical protein QBC46DRAFT_369743 [Diplogelasinospora grovesii]